MTRTGAGHVAAVAGAVLASIGLLGFVPAVTTHIGDLELAGRGSGAKLIGVFQVSVLLNLLHLLGGAPAPLLARTPVRAGFYLVGAAISCLALWLVGAADLGGSIPLDAADDWLHLGLGAVLITLAVVTAGR